MPIDQAKIEAIFKLQQAGFRPKKIATTLGISPITVRRYLDPEYRKTDTEKSRIRKLGYGGICIDCGGSTAYSGNRAHPSLRCRSCAARYREENKKWSREKMILAAHEWVREHGKPPSSSDWNASLSKQPRDTDKYPSTSLVCNTFNQWGDFIEAAGFERPKANTIAPYGVPHWTKERIIEALREAADDGVAPPITAWGKADRGIHPTSAWVYQIFGSWTNAVHAAGLKTFKETKHVESKKFTTELSDEQAEFVKRVIADSVRRRFVVDQLWEEWGFVSAYSFSRVLTRLGIEELPGWRFRFHRQLTRDELAEAKKLGVQ